MIENQLKQAKDPSSTTQNASEQGTKDTHLRPQNFASYFGQQKIIDKFKVYTTASKVNHEPLDHTLLFGMPGLGKTSLAYTLANELNTNITTVLAPNIKKPKDIISLLTKLNAGDILFIDEIHRLSKPIEEILYLAMEDYKVNIIVGDSYNANSIQLDLEPFTLIGATTQVGLISTPLQSRFRIVEKLQLYTEEEIQAIIHYNIQSMGLQLTPEALKLLASSARGVPRLAVNLLRRIRDFAIYHKITDITKDAMVLWLGILGIKENGLTEQDLALLRILVQEFNMSPVGLNTVAIALGEDKTTIADVIEPFLIQQGFLKRTVRGRMATEKAQHLLTDLAK